MSNLFERSKYYNPSHYLAFQIDLPLKKAVDALESFRTNNERYNPSISSVLSVLQHYPVELHINKCSPTTWAPSDWMWIIEPALSKIAQEAKNSKVHYALIFHALEQVNHICPGQPEREYGMVAAALLSEKIAFASAKGGIRA